MILRIVRGHVPPDGMVGFSVGLATRYAPLARRTEGLEQFHVAVRSVADGHELIVVTCWSTVDAALAAYGGDLASVRLLDGITPGVDLREVAYFEVDESIRREPGQDVAAVRVTIGRVARGIDADIQRDLRSRLHELGPELLEAYVGRRMVGTDVEVAFVSAWASTVPPRPLEGPFWQELSERFDAFELAVYRPVEVIVETV